MQEIVVSLMHHCIVTDLLSLVPLSSVSSQQSKAMEDTNKAIKRCLIYCMTFPNGFITFTVSDMSQWVRSDVTQLA